MTQKPITHLTISDPPDDRLRSIHDLPKLPPDIKAEWLLRLRSEDYAQGTGNLKRQFGDKQKPCFCCLGVLCDILDPKAWAGPDPDGTYSWHTSTGAVMPWSDAAESGPILKVLDHYFSDGIDESKQVQCFLAEMNDETQANFADIAIWIEENL